MSLVDHQFPRACQDVLIDRIRRHVAAYDDKIAKLRTKRDAQKLCAASRRKLKRIFGPLPKRTPLNVRTTKVIDRDDHVIENLIFESRPGYYVTANLYLPKGAGPFAGVLQPCGHSANGKAWPQYQALSRALARKGVVSLIFDPVSQGERSNQYGQACDGNSCREHNMAGNQMTLVGDFFGSWRLWDGIRALDVLIKRKEVDPTRVGVSGCSGGGTMTSYLTAIDPRFAFAAPQCFITDYQANAENELPADAEQMPPRMLAEGLDMADFILAYAPRPTILLTERQDMFDWRGSLRTFERLKKVYRLLGKPDDIQLYTGPGSHGYWRDAREACYGFVGRYAGVALSSKEAPARGEDDRTLFATRHGDVLKLPGAKRTCDFIAARADELAKHRGRIAATKLPALVSQTLNLPKRDKPPYFRALRPMARPTEKSFVRGIWPFGLETEPGHGGVTAVLTHCSAQPKVAAPYHRAAPTPPNDATVYVPHVSAHDDIHAGELPRGDRDHGVFTIEPRGIGRLTAGTCNSTTFFEPYGADYFYASHGQMFGESYVGRRVHDVLSALDLLEASGAKRVHLYGRGMGAILAAFAGLLHPLVKRVTLRNTLRSFHELTQTDVYAWPASALPRNVLSHFDLPDVYRALRGKKLKIEKPWDAMMLPTRTRTIR
jgi:dienelactone hydrolase